MTPLISVIVPMYNAEKYVEECLRSIQGQTYSHFEAILINDGSTDGSFAVCERFCKTDDRFRLYDGPNEGVSQARNHGRELAKGEYLTYIDADDWVDSSYLRKLYDLCVRYGCLCSGCNHSIAYGHAKTPCFEPSQSTEFLTLEQSLENVLYHGPPDVSACAKLYHRSLQPSLLFPRGRIFEDTATIVTRLQASGGIAMTYEPLYFYRYTPQSISKMDYTSRNWQLMDAALEIGGQILSVYPHLTKGAVRRKVHAALSIRRLLVRCQAENKEPRERANQIIRQNAWTVMTDRKAPIRDKAAIFLLFLGNSVFDHAWIHYQKGREYS